jgi:hypothetical protein
MAGHPGAGDLIAAVRAFLNGLPLTGRDAFHAKVAANTLAIVERELAAPPTPSALGLSDAELCAAIRAGTLDAATPGLLDALIVATCARLAVDNPRYATLSRLQPDLER